MFSPEIVCSEEFVEMPPSSRELYFQLGMRADDDGFIQPKSVIRAIGAKEDDLKVLIAKRFVLPFGTGVVVIKHWLLHNMIRTDRYKETRFLEEKKSLFIKENKAYTDNHDNGNPLSATKWQPNGNHPAPQVRLGKVSINTIAVPATSDLDLEIEPEEDTIPMRDLQRAKKPPRKQFKSVFSFFGKYPPHWALNRAIIDASERLVEHRGLSNVRAAVQFALEHRNEKYCPQIFTPLDLEEKWQPLFAFKTKNNL